MLLDALVNQFVQRFQYEKRAQACLWFDERQEFTRLLPALHEHLAQMKAAPFRLLEYNADRGQGQVWLKYQVFRAVEAAAPEARASLRFVLYMPLSEDRLDAPGSNGEPPLDLLAEYRIAGVLWRIGGKRPTLFSFLRQAGVVLPASPSGQRRLCEGGHDSLLAKYVAAFVDRPAMYWTTLVTPELAQSRLLGDLDQAILDLAVDPEAALRDLRDRGLDHEFRDLVHERYGFDGPLSAPAEWVRDLVAVLALTETYLGYGQPADFPFLDRLPQSTLRPHHVQLLKRWLRDSECRTAWDHWVAEAETHLDLTKWATAHEGLSFGFPHLVRLRWGEVWAAFQEAATKGSKTAAFFEQYGEVLTKEAEFARASGSPVGAWELLRSLGAFVKACDEARGRAEQAEDVASLARVYVDCAAAVERQHVQLRFYAEEQGFEAVAAVADRVYATYANTLNARFFQHLTTTSTGSIPGFEPVTSRLEETLWTTPGKRAVVIVDALRYDCALAIAGLLRDQQVEVEPLVAMLPTVTPIGMTALLPISSANVGLQIKSNGVHPTVNGKDTSARSNRLAYLKEFGADCRDIADVESASTPPQRLGQLLVVFGHEEVDHIGHGDAQALVRHVHLEIERLARLIRKLHRWGYPSVHMVTDHGFILIDQEKLPEEVRCDKEWCHVLKERFALVPASADLPVATFSFAWDHTVSVAVPPGLAFFKAEKSFSHGGAALQEVIIPHLISRSEISRERRIGVEVVLPTYELMRAAVKIVLRPTPAGVGEAGQIALFAGTGRSITLDVIQTDPAGKRSSVLASATREVRLEPADKEHNVTLFFHTAVTFRKGELLELDIRDAETTEQFPPGGIKLTVGRDM
jgi:hypothetical protein